MASIRATPAPPGRRDPSAFRGLQLEERGRQWAHVARRHLLTRAPITVRDLAGRCTRRRGDTLVGAGRDEADGRAELRNLICDAET